ncbi:FHA domain-containing protein [Rhodanobacter humi]|jgi:pSer/pThr/pTyr-binding forkhead associated (FHA) protein|uniref:FHA domain-containing protein n=2 Tax=Rhodanobacter TaxID=75309 RepID=A0ABV4AKL7_9GAMM
MDNRKPMPPRSAGPQGTRLFSAEALRLQASEATPVSTGRASVNEPVLEGVGGELGGRRFSVRPGRQTIGRRGDNNIVIGDSSVSASHAWIMNQQGHYVIMNTLSTNGTFVNDQRVHESVLRHGDRIRLGQAEFVFLTRDPGASRSRWLPFALIGLVLLAAVAALAWWLL